EPMHGYGIGRWIRQTTDGALAVEEGALYPALHRLERAELIASEWGRTETNRRARIYSLTRRGRARLEREADRWRAFSEAVHAVLDAPREAAS
ncbi:MAG TPA: PadR family transcriptional regulator, partial [Longimicrobiales bacterium]|nr:PadR family transcriptional regulator [Longimicrobiales bacterium]